MSDVNIQLKTISLNVRGIRTFENYCCKINNCCLSRNIFMKKLKRTFCIEGIIAKENNKLECHYSKWGDFLPFTEDA